MHRSFPKPTPRLTARVAKRREALRAWRACVRAVDARDHYRCRCCGRHVTRTLTVCPERLEHHHVHGRTVAPERIADPSNVVTLCLSCHQRVTRHDVTYEGTDADGPLHFTQAEPAARSDGPTSHVYPLDSDRIPRFCR